MAGFASCGALIYQKDGLSSRAAANLVAFKEGDVGHDDFFDVLRGYYPCTPVSLFRSQYFRNAPARCVQTKPGDKKDVAIIGDSHAEHFFIGLAEQLRDKNIVTYIRDGLPMVDDKYREIIQTVSHDPNISIVILGAFWNIRRSELPKGSSLENEL